MKLSYAGEYVAKQTLHLYDQILNIQYFNLIWSTDSLLVGWDSTRSSIVTIFGEWDGDEDDFLKLSEIIFEYTGENGLTEE